MVVAVVVHADETQFGYNAVFIQNAAHDVVIFDGETIQGRICLSALYSFMPKVFAMRFGADFPWLKENKDVSTHACPDAFNPVVFEIRRIRD